MYERLKKKDRNRKKKIAKKITKLPQKEKIKQRKKWAEQKKKYRAKIKRGENSVKEKVATETVALGRAGTSRKKAGEKVIKRNRARTYRKIKKLENEIEKSKKTAEKYKNAFYRLQKKIENNVPMDENSVEAKVTEFLNGEKVSDNVRKELEFCQALSSQINQNYGKNKKSRKSKKAFNLVLNGSIVKRYKHLNKMKQKFGISYKVMKTAKSGNMINELNKHSKYLTKNDLKVKSDILKFFERDDVTCTAPGKKDTVTKKKKKMQKRILCDSLKILQKKFQTVYNYNVPYSTFCSLKPFWVVKPNINARDTCLCDKHENFDYMFLKLKNLKILNYCDRNSLVKSMCCHNETKASEACMERRCNECKKKKFVSYLEKEEENDEIEYFRWVKKEEKVMVKGKEKITQKVVKEKVKTTKKGLLLKFTAECPKFMQHLVNISHQYLFIQDLKKNLKPGELLLHVDFSENYVCKYFREIQSVFYGSSKKQLTLHTGVLYYKKGSETEQECFCTLSECRRHDAPAIMAHLEKALEYSEEFVPRITNLYVLSDSPTNQYRNRSIFFFMQNELINYCENSLNWNYSEAGHGKGAPDGVGGTLKRTADQIVARGKDISNFEEFFETLTKNTNIKLMTVDEKSIAKFEKTLPDITAYPAFPGTIKVHQVLCDFKNGKTLKFFRLSSFNEDQLYYLGSKQKPKKRLRYSDVYSSSDSSDYSEDDNIPLAQLKKRKISH